MGLVDAAQQVVRTYSGGMIRRLEIAEAMLHRPRVLFLPACGVYHKCSLYIPLRGCSAWT
jgi:ABC-type branched-subunit amino acid transport system ATPase component